MGKCEAHGRETKPTCINFVADILVVVVVVLCVLALAYRALGAFLVVLPIEKDRVIKRSVEGYFSLKCVSPIKSATRKILLVHVRYFASQREILFYSWKQGEELD